MPPLAWIDPEYAVPTEPLGSDVVVIVSGPTTVTVVVTAGMLVPLAEIVAVPGPTEVIGTAIVDVGLLFTGNVSVAGTVATAVLLDESVMGTPLDPVGTGLLITRFTKTCTLFPTMVTVGALQAITAPTWMVTGVGEL
jgi:hypothetical protein